MFPHIDEKDIARLLYCLSILEQSIFQFYKRLHEKVKYPLVKSLLLYVAYDSQKHSVILKELGENTANMEEKVDDCERELGVVWKTVVSLSKEISNEENMEDEKLLSLVNKLTDFENVIGEEYLTLVQLKSLEFIARDMPKINGIDLDILKIILEKILEDEEHHTEILLLVKGLLQEKLARLTIFRISKRVLKC